MKRAVKSIVFAMCFIVVMASVILAFGQDGMMLHKHMNPQIHVVTNAWQSVSNKTDALVETKVGPLRTAIAGKQNALGAWSGNPFSGWNGYYIAVPLAMWAQQDEQGHYITQHYATKTELNTATNALQTEVDFKADAFGVGDGLEMVRATWYEWQTTSEATYYTTAPIEWGKILPVYDATDLTRAVGHVSSWVFSTGTTIHDKGWNDIDAIADGTQPTIVTSTEKGASLALSPSATNGFASVSALNSKADKTALNAISNDVAVISTFVVGDDVHLVVTNYLRQTSTLPSLFIREKKPADDTHTNEWFDVVWNEMWRWNQFLTNEWASVTNHVTQNLADRAWGMYDSATGEYSPDGLLQMSHEKILVSGGMAYQKTVTAGGCAVWVLTANEPMSMSGVSSNGFFRIEDGDGTPIFEIVKGDKRVVGATATAAGFVSGSSAFQITYNVTLDEHPMLYLRTSLTDGAWVESGSFMDAVTQWSGSSGNWKATVVPTVNNLPSLFAKATYETGGNTYIKNHVAVSTDRVVVGGDEYNVTVQTVDGRKLLVLEDAQ